MAYSALSVAFLNVFVARDAGLFRKHGLDVELIQMAGPLPIAALSAGEIDYLTGYTTGLVAASQGAPLKGLIVIMRKPPFYIVSEPSIQKPEDLAGKRLAVDQDRQPPASCRTGISQDQRDEPRKDHIYSNRVGI